MSGTGFAVRPIEAAQGILRDPSRPGPVHDRQGDNIVIGLAVSALRTLVKEFDNVFVDDAYKHLTSSIREIQRFAV